MIRNLLAGALALALCASTSALAQPTIVAPGAPATAAPTITPPIAPSARAKFPNEDPRVIDGMAFVNFLVNHSIQPMSDMEHYGVEDKMVSWPVDLKGDCEDYALSKQVTLGRSGVPIVMVTRLRTVMVHFSNGDAFGHAILEVLLPNGGIVFLDNLHDALMTRSELQAEGYEFFDW